MNSKPLESSKHKKYHQIWTKITTLKKKNHEKSSKKEGKKKEGNFPKPYTSFSFFRSLLSLLPTTIYINKKTKQKTITLHGDVDPSPWNDNRKNNIFYFL